MTEQTPIFIMHGVPRDKLSDVMKAVKGVLGSDVIFSDGNRAGTIYDCHELHLLRLSERRDVTGYSPG